MEKIIQESAFDKKKKKPGIKFNSGLALTGVRTTGARMLTEKGVGHCNAFESQTAGRAKYVPRHFANQL